MFYQTKLWLLSQSEDNYIYIVAKFSLEHRYQKTFFLYYLRMPRERATICFTSDNTLYHLCQSSSHLPWMYTSGFSEFVMSVLNFVSMKLAVMWQGGSLQSPRTLSIPHCTKQCILYSNTYIIHQHIHTRSNLIHSPKILLCTHTCTGIVTNPWHMCSEGYNTCPVCLSACYPYSSKQSNNSSYQWFQQLQLYIIKSLFF